MDLTEARKKIRNQFLPPAKVKQADPKDLRCGEVAAVLQRRHEALDEKHRAEREAYEQARPPQATAKTSAIMAWEQAGREMSSRCLAELEALNRDAAEVGTNPSSTYNDRLSAYHSAHAGVATALSAAWDSIAGRFQELFGCLEKIEAAKTGVYELLRKEGAKEADLADGLSDWEAVLKAVYCRTFCRGNGVDPDNLPQVEQVSPPTPQRLNTPRMYKDSKFDKEDVFLFGGGLALAIAMGAASGGMRYASEGWRFETLFWVMAVMGVGLAFALGKKAFPYLASMMVLGTVGVMPWRAGEKAYDRELRNARIFAWLAVFSLVAIFALCFAIESYGWFKAATEFNTAMKSKKVPPIPPIHAALALGSIGSFFLLAKLASVFSTVSKLRHDLVEEVEDRGRMMVAALERYEAACRRRDRLQERLDKAEDVIAEGWAKAEDRMTESQVAVIRRAVADCEALCQSLPSKEQVVSEVHHLVEGALAECQPAREALAKAERELKAFVESVRRILSA